MTIKKQLFSLIASIMTSLSLTAQLSMIVTDATAEKGQVVEIGIMVTGFTEITSMQFSVNWDSTNLSFQSVENLTEALPDFSENEIGLVDASSGALRVLWFDNATQGISIPDSTQLFTIAFEVIGEEGISSGISITDSPLTIEFTDANGMLVELSDVEEGEIVIPGDVTSTTYMEAIDGTQLHQNEPNPFSTTTSIKTIFPSAEIVQFYITDISGRIVYQNTFKSVQGENTIVLDRQQLPTSGTYYYTMQSDRYRLSRKMILLPR